MNDKSSNKIEIWRKELNFLRSYHQDLLPFLEEHSTEYQTLDTICCVLNALEYNIDNHDATELYKKVIINSYEFYELSGLGDRFINIR